MYSLALLGAAAHARAQSCGTTGADIGVTAVTPVVNYQSINGQDAVSFGHTITNMGSVPLQCNPVPSVTHPVLTQNMYRYRVVDGVPRFEQIGMGWVYHEFAVLQQSGFCTTCIAQPTSALLGVGCSSPSSASSVSAQSAQWPRWAFRADTAAFPSSYTPAPVTNALSRRIIMPFAELATSTPSNRYFAEKIVLAPDDAATTNDTNNASSTECAVVIGGGTDATFTPLSGGTAGLPAALRWAQIDPGVKVSAVDIPGDGRVYVLSRATELGSGFHYEYAVFNLTSHRSIGGFSLPVAADIALQNAGFHDVAYHSGDGPGNVDVSGTDWTFTRDTGAASAHWDTETFAQNQAANAVRWGTMYNFRFDSVSPPVAGDATLALFRPGTPDSVRASVVMPGREACPLRLLVPAYFYPLPGSPWDQLAANAGSVPTTVIVNPNSGPGTSVDPSYVSAIASVRNAGAKTIAYVYTSYGARPAATVLSDVEQYFTFYGAFDGVFFDEVSDDPATLAYYRSLAQGVRAAHPGALIVANPGTAVPEAMSGEDVADVFVLYENDAVGAVPYASHVPAPWTRTQPATRVSHMMYHVADESAMLQTLNLAKQNRAGFVFISSDVLPNPYDTLPTYWPLFAQRAGAPCCDSIDFNADGLFPDTADIDDFLSVFSGGPCSTSTCGDVDFNNDGLYPDTTDIDAFLAVFSGGACA